MRPIVRARPLLGTLVEIWAAGPDRSRLENSIAEAFQEIERVQSLLSYHAADSELSRINRSAIHEPVQLDPEVYRLFETIDLLHRVSSGLFDVTVAGALAKLGFDSDAGHLPDAGLAGCWDDVDLRGENTIVLRAPVRIDLSGIAKGYAVDCAYALLERCGIESFGVNAGGDLRIKSDALVPVAIRHPDNPTARGEVIHIDSAAVATSAGYYSARYGEDGKAITPLIHPRTFQTASEKTSVTVIAPTCTLADALTKVVHADKEQAAAALAYFQARSMVLSSSF